MYAEINHELESKYKISAFPLNIAVEVTNNCNLNCVMCSNNKQTRPRGFMTGQTYRRIIDEVARENPHTRIWLDFYGEAMLAGYKLYWMIDYAKKKGCTNVCINTNGTLMKEEYADMLLDAGVDYISLDCDGFSKEVYESIRVGGDRDVFFKNVEYLLAEKQKRNHPVLIDVKVIDMEQNHHEVEQIVEHWKQKGAIVAVRRRAEWVDLEAGTRQSLDNRIACGHAVGTAAITWDGIMSDCVWDYDVNMVRGSIFDHTIKELWGKRNDEFLKLHFEHKWEQLPEMCRKCDNWRTIGEERFDPTGKPIERNYELNEKIFQTR